MDFNKIKLSIDHNMDFNKIKLSIDNAKSTVNINSTIGDPFPVKVGVHQGSVQSPLLFIIVLEALSRKFRTGLPWELLYEDDLVLMADSMEELEIHKTRLRSSPVVCA